MSLGNHVQSVYVVINEEGVTLQANSHYKINRIQSAEMQIQLLQVKIFASSLVPRQSAPDCFMNCATCEQSNRQSLTSSSVKGPT